ncbi:TIGR01777 family protein [Acidipila sp. EB88]|nr:TIGR01777 family protein [Acidipila sp. EB88]
MIGHALVAAARARGMEVLAVQRPMPVKLGNGAAPAPAAPGTILWEPTAAQPIASLEALEDCDAVVHLAGANLAAKRWSPEYKRVIVESRTQPTGALALLLARLQRPPRILLSASATGFYGSRGDETLTEDSGPGSDFLSETCQAWEAATAPASVAGMRVIHMRFGVVLTPFGGALKQMLPLFRSGVGGRLGDGKQWMSWIALEDLLQSIFHMLSSERLDGAINVVSPEPVRNAEFTKALGAALHRPAVAPAPAFALRAAFGEMADATLLGSCRAVPAKLQADGFQFASPDIAAALAKMLA